MNATSFWWLLSVVAKLLCLVDGNWITGNLCWSMPCMNGGSCFGSAYTYLCVCPMNFSGALCEKRLGICQESPCGNRGLCVETGLTSFECRCYFDYVGPLCEEHVPKNDPALWTSLIPVHTRVLFDILQEAYRSKVYGKPAVIVNQEPLNVMNSSAQASGTLPLATSTIDSTPITRPSETTEEENVIRAENIRLEKIFPEISTVPTGDMTSSDGGLPTSEALEITASTDSNMASTAQSSSSSWDKHGTATKTALTTEDTRNTIATDYNATTSIEQNQTVTISADDNQGSTSITEEVTASTSLTSVDGLTSHSGTAPTTYTTERMIKSTSNSIKRTSSIADSDKSNSHFTSASSSDTTSIAIDMTTTVPLSETDETNVHALERTLPSASITTASPLFNADWPDTLNGSEAARNQFLYRLCQQLIAHILPNASSSSAAAASAALSLVSGSSFMANNTADALLAWLKERISSSSTTTTTTMSTIILASELTSALPSLSINEHKIPTVKLQRVAMDDIIGRANENADGEH